ncbi:MAG: protein phosphatase CheZ [Bacteroidota bacterium]|nr:protein phosphatase CheZ [Candidatus Kapabacteria bacterium]MCX7936702.1 protein phosphatase CheZ [Chlorobiota bacterium]MDW8075432.1 protein phosphatase CheZ [Bacteroidota bacterium]MDW8272216.1 protein phosphatase CheZ [Bacteroidota bacterium]
MQDSPELEALFDQVYAELHQHNRSSEQSSGNIHDLSCEQNECIPEPYYSQLGSLLRRLHSTLQELGYDRSIEYAVGDALPDTVERLDFVRKVTAEAATKVLDATDSIKPIHQRLRAEMQQFAQQWQRCAQGSLSLEEFKQLVNDTLIFFQNAPSTLDLLQQHLTQIVMAQDFQDRTNQVLGRAIEITKTVESELVKLLVNGIPPDRKATINNDLLQGPVVNPDREGDRALINQAQVDALLESLGF